MPESPSSSSRAAAPVVVTTKLRIPSPPAQVVERPRIARVLELAAARHLTLVCAPAGYGKTTALAAWRRASDRPTAWVTLDRHDDAPRRLWAHLLAALDRALPGDDAMADAVRALRAGADLLGAVVPRAADALAEPGRPALTIVLDDCHHLDDPAVHATLAAFADAVPAGTHVVLSGRIRPSAALREGRAAAEVTTRHLRLRRAESEALLNGSFGLGLHAAQLDLVAERVEGWPACLGLLAASLDRPDDPAAFEAGFVQAHRLIADYLTEEVLDPLAPDLRRFLRRTSLTRWLTRPLAAVLVDDPRGAAWLDEAAHRHQLTWPADERGERVRHHPLLTAVLRRELRAAEPALERELHGRASRWHELAGVPAAAIEHAGAAGDGRRAARLLHRTGVDLLRGGRYGAVRRLIDGLPADRGPFGPCSEALATLASLLDGAEPELVELRLAELGDREAVGVPRLVAQARAWPFLGSARASATAGREALALARDESAASRHWSTAMLGLGLWFAGDASAARELLTPCADEIADRDARVWALSAIALAAAEDDDADTAARHAHAAVALADGGGKGDRNGGGGGGGGRGDDGGGDGGRGRSGGNGGGDRDGTDDTPRLASVVAWHALADALRRQSLLAQAGGALDRAARVTRTRPGSLYHALTLTLHAELRLARRERGAAAEAAAGARRIADRYADAGVIAVRLDAVDAALQPRGGDVPIDSDPTPAERRVLELLSSDLSTAEIAARLYLSPHTVKSHQRRLYRRLGETTRAAAVEAARRRGLL